LGTGHMLLTKKEVRFFRSRGKRRSGKRELRPIRTGKVLSQVGAG